MSRHPGRQRHVDDGGLRGAKRVRTTLKRGLGRSGSVNSDGGAVYPSGSDRVTAPVMRLYRQPVPVRRRRTIALRILSFVLALISVLVLGVAGGFYLWLHDVVAAVQAHSVDIKRAEKELAVTLPGKSSIALLLGDNQRVGFERSAGGRSDTMMLIRADPQAKAITLLSIPRDLRVPVYCPSSPLPRETTRIDYAFAWCGARGSLETVKKLTGLRINYLITVKFRGFKEIVNDLGGIWLDIDRRYYNKNVGSAATAYSSIDLQPGYQLLSGGSALQFVRFRHTDSDFYRQARQQEFVRALKDQLGRNLDPLKLPAIVSAIAHNVEVGSNKSFSVSTVLGYALFALTLPSGHVIQNYVGGTSPVNVNGADELQASPSSIQQAVEQFTHPDVGVSKAANAAALGIKAKRHTEALSPKQTTLTALNGSGIAGAAANANHLLTLRGYHTLLPPNGLAPNAPAQNYVHTQIYFDAAQPGSATAAHTLQPLLAPADVRPLPSDPVLRALDPGSMIVVLTGQSFRNVLTTPAAVTQVPQHAPAVVRLDPLIGRQLLAPFIHRVPFRLETPTVLERSSGPDTAPGDDPAVLYTITKGHKAVRLVFRTGSGDEFWGIEETDWSGAPVLAERHFQHALGAREFQLYYSGAHLHMVVLKLGATSYWVVNTLLDSLSNETMLAIARGLTPLGRTPKRHSRRRPVSSAARRLKPAPSLTVP